MKYYDVSMPIRDGMLSWPSDPPVSLRPAKTVAEHGSNVARLAAGTHLGTHFDAPKHFEDDGDGVDLIPIEKLIGPAVVADLTGIAGNLIGPDDLAAAEGAERILIKTTNSTRHLLEKPFTEDYVALSGDGAEWLADQGTVLVGIDYLSVQRRGSDRRAHTALLESGIAVVEGLCLAEVPAGPYELFALPLRIDDGDGAPARVVLRSG